MAEPTVARFERRSVAMKVETAYGVDVFGGTVAAGDVLEAHSINPAVGPQLVDIPNMGGKLTNLGSVMGLRTATVSFEMIPRGAQGSGGVGAVYSASVFPNFHNPLRCCGFQAVGSFTGGAEKWTYTPRSDSFESFTIYVMQEQGPTVKLKGCVGDCTMVFQIGRPVAFRFNFTGIYVTETDAPTLVTKTIDPTSPPYPVLLGANFQLGAENFAAKFSQCQLALQQQLDVQEAPNDSAGIAGVFIGSRRITGTIDPEVVQVATFPWITKWEAYTPNDMSFQTNGNQYGRLKVSMPRTAIRTRAWGQRGQKAVWNVGFDCLPSAGDDELAIEAS